MLVSMSGMLEMVVRTALLCLAYLLVLQMEQWTVSLMADMMVVEKERHLIRTMVIR